MAIQSLGWQARSFTGQQAGIITGTSHGTAKIREIRPDKIESSLKRGEIAVVAGFQGITDGNDITTLGQGGSDTTAVALLELCRQSVAISIPTLLESIPATRASFLKRANCRQLATKRCWN